MRSGLLGGTFDPPHRAHLALAEASREALLLDRVVFVPAGDPWRKAGREVTPAADRLAMTRAAIEGLPWAEVSDIEVRRDGPSYTADTLEALAADGGEWWFILGADALADMRHWRSPDRIVALARLAVARRPDASLEDALAALDALVPGIRSRVDEVPMPLLEVSATDLRARLRDGRPVDNLVPAGVLRVIEERGLYGRRAVAG